MDQGLRRQPVRRHCCLQIVLYAFHSNKWRFTCGRRRWHGQKDHDDGTNARIQVLARLLKAILESWSLNVCHTPSNSPSGLALFCCRPALFGIDGWVSKSAVTATALSYIASQTYWSALSSLHSFITKRVSFTSCNKLFSCFCRSFVRERWYSSSAIINSNRNMAARYCAPFRCHLPVTSPMRGSLQGTHSWKFQERLPDWTNF